MSLKMCAACAAIATLGANVAGCADLGQIALNALREAQAGVEDQTISDELNNANSGSSADNANRNDNSEDEDHANENLNNAEGNSNDSLPGRDLSGFRRFTFSRSPGLGFCPPLGEVYTASVLVDASGAHVLELAVLGEGVPGVDACIGTSMVPCAATVQLEQRTLTGAEVTALESTFSNVRVDNEADPICLTVAIDPCVINQFAWDSFFVQDYICSAERLPPDQANEIISLLEQLRSVP